MADTPQSLPIVNNPPSFKMDLQNVANSVIIRSGDKTITFDFSKDPVSVTVSPNMTMNTAGKLLLNEVAALVNSPKPFPDTP